MKSEIEVKPRRRWWEIEDQGAWPAWYADAFKPAGTPERKRWYGSDWSLRPHP